MPARVCNCNCNHLHIVLDCARDMLLARPLSLMRPHKDDERRERVYRTAYVEGVLGLFAFILPPSPYAELYFAIFTLYSMFALA